MTSGKCFCRWQFIAECPRQSTASALQKKHSRKSVSDQEGRTMTGEKIGFVGVGRMGGRMARRLLKAGVPLTIYDTSGTAMKELQALGANAAGSPAEVGSACEIVFVCL